jgi:hypothetical protein
VPEKTAPESGPSWRWCPALGIDPVEDDRTVGYAARMASEPPPIRVNRTPVLTLWATMVADPLDHPPCNLGRPVVGSGARSDHLGQRL